MPVAPKAASKATAAANRAALKTLAFDDVRDFADVQRGLIAPLPDGGVIRTAEVNRSGTWPSRPCAGPAPAAANFAACLDEAMELFPDADAGQISTEGDRSVFTTLTVLLDDFSPYFALTNSHA
ncbi:hypothetical protein [Streptomyces sp. RKAG293]|uniref:hypothetical protein n=1 Tax=Streptomyces sp. RKAG293 TaxID=2893403 RepID=UPI002033F243|nr:hypothetical protein [Streptomyces sp. RKAG293]MCM2420102.1 hypothetical protein [Streptomyces sp. RKAG293]